MAVDVGNCKNTLTENDLRFFASFLEKVAWFEYLREEGIDLTPFRNIMRKNINTEELPQENEFWHMIQELDDKPGSWAENYANSVKMFISDYGPPGWNPNTCKIDWKEYACFCNGGAKIHFKLRDSGLHPEKKDKILGQYFSQFDGSKDVMPFDCSQETLVDPIYDELNNGKTEMSDDLLGIKKMNRTTKYITAGLLTAVFIGIVAWSFWPKKSDKQIAEEQYRLARGY